MNRRMRLKLEGPTFSILLPFLFFSVALYETDIVLTAGRLGFSSPFFFFPPFPPFLRYCVDVDKTAHRDPRSGLQLKKVRSPPSPPSFPSLQSTDGLLRCGE